MVSRQLLTALLLAGLACTSDVERPGTEPTAPYTAPVIAGLYEATSLLVQRGNTITELIGEPDTRLNLQLTTKGDVHGQLKIGTDPELRDKRSLIGRWQVHRPDFVSFELRPRTFLNETLFRVTPQGMVGQWAGEGVSLRIVLAKVD